MFAKEVQDYLKNNKIDQLYKKYESSFELIDKWSERLIQGDLLNEYEIALCIDQATGVYGKLSSVCGALEAIMSETEYNTEVNLYTEIMKTDKVKTSDTPIIKAKARASANDLRRYFSDFNNYVISAEKMILSAQSRLKRLTVEKGAKGVDFTGERPLDSSAKPGSW